MSENIKQDKKTRISLMLSWVFGVLFGLSGIFSVFSDPIPGLSMLIISAVLIPPVARLISQKLKLNFSKGIKAGVIIVCLIIFSATISSPDNSSDQKNKMQEIDQLTNSQEEGHGLEVFDQLNDDNLENNTNSEVDIVIEDNINSDKKTTETLEEKKSIDVVENNNTTNNVEVESKSEPKQAETVSQRNAIRSAKAYLDYSSFSRSGLIKQLEYEKFSNSDAIYGVDNSGADWYEQAAKSAQQYLDYSSFSRGSLIDQLKYEGFTQSQAEHGANAVGF